MNSPERVGLLITEKAKDTTVEDCEFEECAAVDEGTGSRFIRTKFFFRNAAQQLKQTPWWIKIGLFLAGAVVTSVIDSLIKKYWQF